MVSKKAKKTSILNKDDENDAEIQVQKSPAEFFAENQAIAGFDNMGKSLYTTIRELIENALDACECIHQLPKISIHIQEYGQTEFNLLSTSDLRLQQTVTTSETTTKNISPDRRKHEQIDTKLFAKKRPRKTLSAPATHNDTMNESVTRNAAADECTSAGEGGIEEVNAVTENETKSTSTSAEANNSKQNQYFVITVTDNGCGMAHTAIPDMFGRVLSGSKYGVRQTRGKFGLGAKMALIWSKKSTGHPIHILTAHQQQASQPKTDTGSNDTTNKSRSSPSHVSSCILDIDIYKNQPCVIEHTKVVNNTDFIGTIVRVLIAGNWTTYKSRVVQYIHQLAIITPYAELSMTYTEPTGKRDMYLMYHRRSEQMPDMPSTVKYHPASVNNIIIQQLIQQTQTQNLVSFLSQELQSISISLAKRLITEISASTGISDEMKPSALTNKQITRLVQLFHQVQLFRPPDGKCLSPLGEYNLNLGIQQVLEPDLIVTTRDKVSVYEGHPFLIEAAVSLGGKNTKEGVTVYRFANRIPLLFEGGADVTTRVALTKIKWSNYKIDYKRDKVGVFVSIVSTKIPFKGTSKEYIGDDATEIHLSVKRALQSCCQQLRSHLMKRNALKDAQTRRSKLTRYIPDISRSLYGLLDGLRKRRIEMNKDMAVVPSVGSGSPVKRLRLNPAVTQNMLQMLNKGQISEDVIQSSLIESIDSDIPSATLDDKEARNNDISTKVTAAAAVVAAKPLYIVPLYNLDDATHDIHLSLYSFRPIAPLVKFVVDED